MSSRPSGSLSVTMATFASRSMTRARSTSLPATLAPSAALASPGPMDAATSPTVTGFSNCRTDPSGSVMWTMMYPFGGTYPRSRAMPDGVCPPNKKRGRAALFRCVWTRARLPNPSGMRRSWRSHNHEAPFRLAAIVLGAVSAEGHDVRVLHRELGAHLRHDLVAREARQPDVHEDQLGAV